jgi:hypothetical protein
MIAAVTVDTLNHMVEFDSPFRVIDSNHIDTSLPEVWAPSVYGFGDADGQITERETIDGRDADDMAERHAAGSQDTDCAACFEGIAEEHQYEPPADSRP